LIERILSNFKFFAVSIFPSIFPNTIPLGPEHLHFYNELSANSIGKYELTKIDSWFEGYNYRIAPPGAILEKGMLKANVAFPGLIIRYTTDGSDPNINSAVYKGPVAVSGKVKVRAFDYRGNCSRVFEVK
jgi:hypothetical protein